MNEPDKPRLITSLDRGDARFLSRNFYSLFEVVAADTDKLKEQAHHLRYQIFCLQEKGFENPEEHPDQLERDDFDSHADNILIRFKPTGEAFGVIRVIYPYSRDLERSFPMQTLISARESPLLHGQSAANIVEYSRLGIWEQARSDIKECIKDSTLPLLRHFRKANPNLPRMLLSMAPLGLFNGAVDAMLKKNILTAVSIMEPRHRDKLASAGLIWHRLGPDKDFHGQRTPFLFNIREIFHKSRDHHPEVWHIVSAEGRHHKQAEIVMNKRLTETLAWRNR